MLLACALLIPKIYLTYPTGIFDIAKSASGILCFAAIVLGFLLFYVSSSLFDKKRESIKEFFNDKRKSNTVYFVLFFMFLANQTVFVSTVSKSITKSILSDYPQYLISLFFVLICAAGASVGLKAIIRANCFFLPFTVFMTVLLSALSFNGFDYYNLFPVFGEGIKMFPYTLMLCSFFGDFTVIFLLMPFSEEKVSCKSVFLNSFFISSALLLLVTLTYLLSVGKGSSESVFIPVYQIARYIYYKGMSIRAESIFAVSWLLVFFTNTALFIYVTSLLCCRIFNTKKLRYAIWSISALLFLGSMFLKDGEVIKKATGYVTAAKVAVEVIIPVLFMFFWHRKTKSTKKALTAFLSLILCISLCGCFGAEEVSDMAYIVSVGIDPSGGGMYEYTFQSAIPSDNESDSEKENPFFTVSKIAPSIYSAVDMLNSEIPKKCDFSHIKMILFSKDMFTKENKSETEEIIKCKLFYPNTHLVLSKDSAKENLLKIDIPLDTNPARYYENIFFDDYAKNKLQSKIKNENENSNNPPSVLVLPVLGDGPEINRRAVIKNLSFCGFIEPDDAYFLSAFKDKDFTQDHYFSEGEKSAVLKLSRTDKKVYVKEEGKNIRVSVSLAFSGQVTRSSFSSDSEAKRFAEKEAKKRLLNLFYTCSKEYNSDVFLFANNLKTRYKTVSEWESAGFYSRFGDAKYDVSIKIK